MAAKTWGVPISREIGKSTPDCGRCRRPEAKAQRISWGCDAPVERSVFTTGCSTCFGSNPDCKACDDGVVHHKQCHSAVINSYDASTRRSASRAQQAYIQFIDRGVLPYTGGYMEQAPQFHRIVELIDHERGRFEKALQKHRAKKVKTPESPAKPGARKRRR